MIRGPARAIKCAETIVESLAALGIVAALAFIPASARSARAAQGIALHIAARVAALAPPGGVLVSQTVKDLVAGSGIHFEDAGLQTLKGLPEDWRLYKVISQ